VAYGSGVSGSQELKVHLNNEFNANELRLPDESYPYLLEDGAAFVTAKIINIEGGSAQLDFVVVWEKGQYQIKRSEIRCTENPKNYQPETRDNGFTIRLINPVKTTAIFKIITVI
jgi:hypothetical protein